MRSVRLGMALVALCGISLVPTPSHAHEIYVPRVPRAATAMNSEGIVRPCINCHNNPDGGAGCGKTPATMVYASCASQLRPTSNGMEPRFYKVSQIESLRRDDLLSRVALRLDEFSPSLTRGHKPVHNVD